METDSSSHFWLHVTSNFINDYIAFSLYLQHALTPSPPHLHTSSPPHTTQGSIMIARYMKLRQGNALVHCSDGWDRTSQLTSLTQLMMDYHYRTVSGFMVTFAAL